MHATTCKLSTESRKTKKEKPKNLLKIKPQISCVTNVIEPQLTNFSGSPFTKSLTGMA